MRSSLLALEDNTENVDVLVEEALINIDPAQLTEERIDAEAVEMQDQLAQLHNDSDAVEEAASMADAVSGMADVAEQAVQAEQALPAPTAEVMEVAMEHFYTRLGIEQPRRLMPALEAFEKDGLASTKVAAEHLRNLQDRIQTNISVAQESLGGRIVNMFSRVFTSNAKMVKSTQALNSANLAEEHSLGKPAWGRVFAVSGKSKVGGADILKAITEINDVAAGEFTKLLNDVAKEMGAIYIELKRNPVWAADGSVKEIERIASSVEKRCEKIGDIVPNHLLRAKKDVEVVSCDKASFGKIVNQVRRSADLRELERAGQRYWTAYVEVTRPHDHPLVQLMRLASPDARAARKALSVIGRSIETTGNAMVHRQTAAMHGAYKYLQASTKK
jgi:hypothetical protein